MYSLVSIGIDGAPQSLCSKLAHDFIVYSLTVFISDAAFLSVPDYFIDLLFFVVLLTVFILRMHLFGRSFCEV